MTQVYAVEFLAADKRLPVQCLRGARCILPPGHSFGGHYGGALSRNDVYSVNNL